MKRRHFIKSITLAGVYIQLPFFVKCNFSPAPKLPFDAFKNYSPLNTTQKNNTIVVQQLLFPDEQQAPGALKINAFPYFISVLNDPYRDKDENNYLIKGLDRLNQIAIENSKQNFWETTVENQQKFLHYYIKNKGESWASAMLSIIFEALLSNPIYGGNTDEIGWKWLKHIPGQPQPTEINKYPDLPEKRKKTSEIITSLEQILNE